MCDHLRWLNVALLKSCRVEGVRWGHLTMSLYIICYASGLLRVQPSGGEKSQRKRLWCTWPFLSKPDGTLQEEERPFREAYGWASTAGKGEFSCLWMYETHVILIDTYHSQTTCEKIGRQSVRCKRNTVSAVSCSSSVAMRSSCTICGPAVKLMHTVWDLRTILPQLDLYMTGRHNIGCKTFHTMWVFNFTVEEH